MCTYTLVYRLRFFFSRVYLIFCISGGIWQHRKKNAENITIPKRNWTNEHELDKQTKKKQQQMWSHTFNNNSNNSNQEKPHTPNNFFCFPLILCTSIHSKLSVSPLEVIRSWFGYLLFILLLAWCLVFFVHFYLLVNITLIRMQYSQSIIINDAEFFWIKFL